MAHFEQTFMNFILQHQEQHNRTHHFLILIGFHPQRRQAHRNGITSRARSRETWASRAASTSQGEDVMRMDPACP